MLEAGLRPVCLHARGCGVALTSPRFNLFGDTQDLGDAIGRIAQRQPGAPLCLQSISAGTALMVRYLGEQGASAPIAAAVANCPGYDIGVCITRVGWLYDAGYYLSVLKRHWLGGANGELLRAAAPEVCARMEQAADMHTFMSAAALFAAPLGGGRNSGSVANAFAAFLGASNPMGVAHRIQVPALIVNADDDPVVSPRNTDENAPQLLAGGSGARMVLLRYPAGGHCCFARGLRAKRWVDELSAGFLGALAREEPAIERDET